eukprot:4051719-Amphidinium_carterae.1
MSGVPEGRSFMDFVHPSDQTRLTDAMKAAEQACLAAAGEERRGSNISRSVAPAVHVSLVDVNRCIVDVQIFVGSCMDVLGCVTHHLGICEQSHGDRVSQQMSARPAT